MSDQVGRDASFVIPVLILGDVMPDRHVHGHVRRISPKAPVPVLILAGEVLTPATPAGDRSGKPGQPVGRLGLRRRRRHLPQADTRRADPRALAGRAGQKSGTSSDAGGPIAGHRRADAAPGETETDGAWQERPPPDAWLYPAFCRLPINQ
jgi:hypothetical protein